MGGLKMLALPLPPFVTLFCLGLLLVGVGDLPSDVICGLVEGVMMHLATSWGVGSRGCAVPDLVLPIVESAWDVGDVG